MATKRILSADMKIAIIDLIRKEIVGAELNHCARCGKNHPRTDVCDKSGLEDSETQARREYDKAAHPELDISLDNLGPTGLPGKWAQCPRCGYYHSPRGECYMYCRACDKVHPVLLEHLEDPDKEWDEQFMENVPGSEPAPGKSQLNSEEKTMKDDMYIESESYIKYNNECFCPRCGQPM